VRLNIVQGCYIKIFSFLGEEAKTSGSINKGDIPKIVKVETLSLSKGKSGLVRKVANRNSAVALIVNTANSCPFKYVNHAYKCFYCKDQYSEFMNLHQHTNKAHQQITESDIRKAFGRTCKDQKIKVNFMTLSCKICGVSFENFKDLKVHIKEHDKPVDVDDDGVLPYKIVDDIYECLICGAAYKNYGGLNRHMNSHFPYYVCNRCGVACATIQRFKQHVSNHSDRSYSCEVCHKTYPTAPRKKEHMERVHLKLKQNKCTLCPETFNKYYEKVRHLKTVHGKI
jgi:hypothetical protein